MHNPQRARDLANFLAPALENALDVNADPGSLDSCSCDEKVVVAAEPDVDFAMWLELREACKKGLALRDGAGQQATGKLSDRLAQVLEGDDHAAGVLWALLAGGGDQPDADARQQPFAGPPRGGSAPGGRSRPRDQRDPGGATRSSGLPPPPAGRRLPSRGTTPTAASRCRAAGGKVTGSGPRRCFLSFAPPRDGRSAGQLCSGALVLQTLPPAFGTC